MNVTVAPSLELRELARRTVPRYTSYPTAPHFSPAVDGQVHSGWLEDLKGSDKPVSIYLHVPFCRAMCHYCGCNTKATRVDDPIAAYAEVMQREIALAASITGRIPVSHIHWGGGTPNLLPPECFEAIVGDLVERFHLLPGMEHAIELDPRYVSREGAQLLARLGVTRASLGVQDLNPRVQVAIGRVQPFEKVAEAAAALREAGIEALNFDLMYGLPLQTVETVRDTARKALTLRPSRIALFGYAHIPWMKSHQRLIDEKLLPDADQRILLARASREVLDEAGYVEIGIDHFALPGDELTLALQKRVLRRNFQGYTTDAAETLIGFGASSIGRTRFGFVQNASDTAGWQRLIETGQLPVTRGKAFEGEDLVRSDVIEDLLCFFEAGLDQVARRHGFDASIFEDDLRELAPFIDAGWVTRSGDRVAIVQHRREIARVVASAFDSYLGKAGRHSVAV